MRLVPAGVSKKTGKPYREFYSCPNKSCGATFNPKSDNPPTGSAQNEQIMNALRELFKQGEEIKELIKKYGRDDPKAS